MKTAKIRQRIKVLENGIRTGKGLRDGFLDQPHLYLEAEKEVKRLKRSLKERK